MTGYYYAISKLKTMLEEDGFVNTITTGDLFDVDLSKQTIYPLTHIIGNSATIGEQIVNYNISLIFMDIVDISKQPNLNQFDKNDNQLDVLNTQLSVANRLVQKIQRGTHEYNLEIVGDVTCEPFTDRFENKVAGWTITFDLAVSNEMTIC